MTNRTLTVAQARKLLADERNKILAELGGLEKIDTKERQAEGMRRLRRRMQMGEALARGREFDLSMVEMAEALGTTRQMAHVLLRDYEEGQRAKSSRTRKGAKGA